MDNTWVETTIGNLLHKGSITIQTGPFGSQLHSYDYEPVGIPVIPTEAIGRRRLITEGVPRVSPATANRLSRHKLRAGDILFARRGVQATGLSALVEEEHSGWLCGTGAILLRVNDQSIDPTYLSFLLSTDSIIEWLKQHAVGAVMPNLNETVIRGLRILLPTFAEQRAIADVLGSLDDKIEVNRHTNTTLESMARAVFRQWFVENEEVRNWHGGYLSDVANIIKGVSYRSVDLVEHSDTALVTLKSMERGGGYREDGLKPYSGEYKPTQKLLPGEVVIAHTDLTQAADVIGRAARIESSEKHPNLVASLDMAIVRPKEKPYTNEYLYGLLSQVEFSDHAYGYTNGTTVLHLSTKALPEYQLRIPPKNKVEEFSKLTSPIFLQIDNNKKQSRTLASPLDSLLPKLMRGEVRVKYVEKEL